MRGREGEGGREGEREGEREGGREGDRIWLAKIFLNFLLQSLVP